MAFIFNLILGICQKGGEMPRGDGRGPEGKGPMTGRNMGFCAGYNMPGFANEGRGCGMGRGRRFARGMWNAAPVAATGEKEELQLEAAALRQQLELLEKRIASLPGGSKQ